MVVGIPIGTNKYVLERAMGVVENEDANRLDRCFPITPDKPAAATGRPRHGISRVEDKLR